MDKWYCGIGVASCGSKMDAGGPQKYVMYNNNSLSCGPTQGGLGGVL